ncbi:MAG: hypothetical protein JST93_17145 [Acidobacteria bacterium]|jgi:hypothetical protein|nr:hypothetical protein [Acidobacteriota bacterium]
MLLRIASMLVPEGVREEWLAEWRGELEFVRRQAPGQALRFVMGAWKDAWWMRRNGAAVAGSFLDSPGRCLAVLGMLAAACCWLSGGQTLVRSGALFAMTMGIALLVLPASTPLRVVCAASHRWWMFLGAKMLLVLLVVFWGTAIAVGTKTVAGPHGIILGIVLGLRWALLDQRRRCPECLRRLRHPAGIGAASHTFLEWHGTELVCPRGHGLLHVSEIGSLSCYAPLRWLPLDASWRGLFRARSGVLRGELPQE